MNIARSHKNVKNDDVLCIDLLDGCDKIANDKLKKVCVINLSERGKRACL